MRDEQICQTELTLQIGEKIEDFGLNGNVESRCRLIKDNKFRPQDQCARNRDPLPLPTGEFVWQP